MFPFCGGERAERFQSAPSALIATYASDAASSTPVGIH